MGAGLERVNVESHTFSFSGSHNIFVKALHDLRPGVHQHRFEVRPRFLLFISCSFNPLSRGLDERGSHFRLEKNLIKQDALTTHAQRLPGNAAADHRVTPCGYAKLRPY